MTATTPGQVNEGVPIPCQRCGAAMEEANKADLHGVEMKCLFCGATETLPADAAKRVLAVRTRLQKIAWARQNADAPALAMAQAITQYKMLAIPMLLMICMPCLMQVPSFIEGPITGARALTMGLGPLISLSIAVAVMGGSFAGLVGYRRELLPGLLAFPPSSHGAPLRCRVCGGNLPNAPSGAFVPCRYCTAKNLVSADVAKRREEDLQRELAAHQAQATGVASRMEDAKARMMRYTWIGVVGGWLFAALLSAIGYALLSAMS